MMFTDISLSTEFANAPCSSVGGLGVVNLGGRRILSGRWMAFLGGLALLVLATLFTPSPVFAADDIPISTAEDVQTDPAVAYNSLDEEYLVVWQDHRFGLQEFYGQRVSSNGQLLGGELAIIVDSSVADSKAIVYGNGGIFSCGSSPPLDIPVLAMVCV